MLSDLANFDYRIGDLTAMKRHLLLLERKINDLEFSTWGASALYNENGRLVTTNTSSPLERTYDENGNIATQKYKGTILRFTYEPFNVPAEDGSTRIFYRLIGETEELI